MRGGGGGERIRFPTTLALAEAGITRGASCTRSVSFLSARIVVDSTVLVRGVRCGLGFPSRARVVPASLVAQRIAEPQQSHF